MSEQQTFLPRTTSTAKERRLNDKSITNGLEFCKYHLNLGKSRDEVATLIAGMYDFVLQLRQWDREYDEQRAAEPEAAGDLVN